MLTVSTRSLNILAALVWYIGGIVLLLKGKSLLVEAETLNPQQGWSWLAVIVALFLGSLKARFLFSKSCRKNLNRIAALAEPKIWQCFRPGFFVALAIMIAAGAALSRLAHNTYPFLIGVGILDLSLAVALLGGSIVFWQQKAFTKQHVKQDHDFTTR
jgi:hypothetical protein